MGFSAGGELAALASTQYDAGVPRAADPVQRESSKPAFQALLYPAIPRDLTLSKDTPPAFLVCGEDDRQDIAQGLPELYLALKRGRRVGRDTRLRWRGARLRDPASQWRCGFHCGRNSFSNGSSAECFSRPRALEQQMACRL
jgi:hypothetical protein